MTTTPRHGVLVTSAVVALIATLCHAPSPAGAAVQARTGTLSSADPVMGVVSINGTDDTCGTQGPTQVHYEVIPWTAPVGGTVDFRLTSAPANAASFYVYDGPFDPANAEENCVAADNSADNPGGQKIVTLEVQDEKTYRLVVFDDTFTQAGATFRMEIEVPGGKATAKASGKGRKYLALPGSFSCAELTARIAWKKKATKVRSAVVRANRRVVARWGDAKIGPGRSRTVRDLPGNTAKLSAVLRLKGGGKVKVDRHYTRC